MALGALRREIFKRPSHRNATRRWAADVQHRYHPGRHQDQYRAGPLRGPVDIRTIPGQDLTALLDSMPERFPGVQFERRISGPLKTDPALIPSSAYLNPAEPAAPARHGSAMQRCWPPPEHRPWRLAPGRSNRRTPPTNGFLSPISKRASRSSRPSCRTWPRSDSRD